MKIDRKSLAWIGIGGVITSIIGYVAIRQQLKWMNEQESINAIPYPIINKRDRRASPIWTTKYRGPWS